MSETITVASWTLLTVLYGGHVDNSPGFRTQYECLEARSLVLHHRTLEEQAAWEKGAAERRPEPLVLTPITPETVHLVVCLPVPAPATNDGLPPS